MRMTAFSSLKNWFTAIMSTNHSLEAIWREQKVDPCYLDAKICSSQLFRARKIVSQ